MNKKFNISITFDYQKHMKGIYRIDFGGKFYIGMAKQLQQRVYQHETSINKCIEQFHMPPKYAQTYLSISRYLLENPKITEGRVQIIQRAITTADLCYMEANHLNHYRNHADCMNKTFEGTRKGIFDTHISNAWVDDVGIIRFTDSDLPN